MKIEEGGGGYGDAVRNRSNAVETAGTSDCIGVSEKNSKK